MNIEVRYSPYSAPFVPAMPANVYWVRREDQYGPHDQHVRAFLAYRQSLTAGLVQRYQQQKRDKVMDLLEDMAADGIQAARFRLQKVRRAENVQMGGSIAGERGACDVRNN